MELMTKKLDKMHVWDSEAGKTLCGRFCLGNDYSKFFKLNCLDIYEDIDHELPSRGMCPICAKKAKVEK